MVFALNVTNHAQHAQDQVDMIANHIAVILIIITIHHLVIQHVLLAVIFVAIVLLIQLALVAMKDTI